MMDIEKDLHYLAETDEKYATLDAELTQLEDEIKWKKGNVVSSSNSSVSKAVEEFYASSEYKTFCITKMNKALARNTLRNKRATAILRIDVWRTLEASRRKGNIQ